MDFEHYNLLLKQLKSEWLNFNYHFFSNRLNLPLIELSKTKTVLGRWESAPKRLLSISETLIGNYPWEMVQEVLCHEMAHQFVDEVLHIQSETSHGETFRRVCNDRWINHRSCVNELDWKRQENIFPENAQLRRVKKLLSLAQSTNVNEAELAMARAHEILVKYNLSLREDNSRTFIHRQIGGVGKNPIKSMIASILHNFFFVEVLWVQSFDAKILKAGRIIEIYGSRENVDMAEYVFHFLQNTSEQLWIQYKQIHAIKINRPRRNFIYGLLNGFYKKLDSTINKNKDTSLFALIQKSDLQLKKQFNLRNKRVSSSPIRYKRTHRSVYDAGMEKGKTLNIHKPLSTSNSPMKRINSPLPCKGELGE